MNTRILDINKTGKTMREIVGGKCSNLGELCAVPGIDVPAGFCVTTQAFKEVVGENTLINELLDQLQLVKLNDQPAIRNLAGRIRGAIENIPMPGDLRGEISAALARHGGNDAYAVRSSATAEDLDTASFAGQQDTFLNITGEELVCVAVSQCWASLFTERAIIYRMKRAIDHRKVRLAVIVQKMVFADVSGIAFTADPVTGNRKVLCIEASFGLGEALVSGLVNADSYQVKGETILSKTISAKKVAIRTLDKGGTATQNIEPGMQQRPALDDTKILALAQLCRTIEKHFGNPQDIEWCLADEKVFIVQSRPITTLYPIPEQDDNKNHVYISVGHQQMMTDPMKPLGLSVWQLRAARPMFKAAGRLFVDVSDNLATAAGREALLDAMDQHDPLIASALKNLVERGDFIESVPEEGKAPLPVKATRGLSAADILKQVGNGPSIINDLVKNDAQSVIVLRQELKGRSGPELFDFIVQDIEQSKKQTFDPKHFGVLVTVINAAAWINANMEKWLGEKNAADILSQSVPNNVTSEMGLALLDVADAIRPYSAIIAYLQQLNNDSFPDSLLRFHGGEHVQKVIYKFLERYGMRCAGEIDITRTRWAEKPVMLVPLILANIRNFAPGAGKAKFEQGLKEARDKEHSLLERLKQLEDGDLKVQETISMIHLLRNFAGYREYPKYGIVARLFAYKEALLNEARRLVESGVIDNVEEVYYLRFHEFREMVTTRQPNPSLIRERMEEFQRFEQLTPPRVITSDGEIISGNYAHKQLPAGAIAGLGVSSGIVEGRARVIPDMEDASLESGDILVTTFTDPSWTPLFLLIKGLVTEVGGMMTHGAVVAREYGLPAVVGVQNAVKRIKDGQRIRINGTEGYVEIL